MKKEAIALIKEVKKKIKPTKDETEKLLKIFKEFKERVKVKGDMLLLGSVAKGTYLRGEHDLDVFVFFDKNISKEEAAGHIFNALKNAGIEFEKSYAEHPYAKAVFKGIKIDVVPAYRIRKGEKIKSAVDRSYHHYEFIIKNLREEQKDEVRLLKKFLKNLGLYGAEVLVNGFSGYLCELFILKFGSFIETLRFFSTFEGEKLSLGEKETLELFREPLVFIDPVDKYRNVASPVSMQTLARFKLYSTQFLLNPKEEFFYLEKMRTKRGYEEELGKSIAICFPSPQVVEETKNGQLKRIERAIKKELSNRGFLISNSFVYDNGKKSCIVISSPKELEEKRVVAGPSILNTKHSRRFIEKHSSYLFEDRLYTLKDIKKRGIKENAEDFLKKYNFPSHYRNGYRVMELGEVEKEDKDLKDKVEIELKRYLLLGIR